MFIKFISSSQEYYFYPVVAKIAAEYGFKFQAEVNNNISIPQLLIYQDDILIDFYQGLFSSNQIKNILRGLTDEF